MAKYQVFLTDDAKVLLDPQFISRYIHIIGHYAFLQPESIDPDGVYLHLKNAEPLSGVPLRPADFLLHHEHVLYIASGIPEKTLGFESEP
jgi:hypothetical protein